MRTTSVKVTVTPGTWRLRLCAGPKNGRAALRADQARAHAHAHASACPPRKVLVRSPNGALRVTAALVDKRQRIRAQGSAASA